MGQTEDINTEDIDTEDIKTENINTENNDQDMRFELESEFDESENWTESDDNDFNRTEAESICKNNGNQKLNGDHKNTVFESDNNLTSLKDIKLETFDNHEGDQINLQSERREISPSFESNRGAGDSPRRSTSKKKCVFAIGSMLMFVGSLRSVFLTDCQKFLRTD